jgi:hypothetical protein
MSLLSFHEEPPVKVSLFLAFLALLALLGANLWLTNRSVAELQRNEERITDLQARLAGAGGAAARVCRCGDRAARVSAHGR